MDDARPFNPNKKMIASNSILFIYSTTTTIPHRNRRAKHEYNPAFPGEVQSKNLCSRMARPQPVWAPIGMIRSDPA